MTAVELAKIEQLKNDLERLKEALQDYQSAPNLLSRDGIIQRFEFTCELVWKTLKEHIEYLGQSPKNNPRDMFRVAADQELIADPQIWFHFLDNRNISTHLYDESEMAQVFSDIPSFIIETEKILAKLSRA